jgi:hypothetical protein
MLDYNLVATTEPLFIGSIIFCKLNKDKLLVFDQSLEL